MSRSAPSRDPGPPAAATTASLLAALLLLLAPSGSSGAGATDTASCSVAGTVGLLRVSSARVQTRGVLSLSLAANYYESDDLSAELGFDEPGRYTSVHLNASYGVTNWLELAVDLPFRRATWSGSGADVSGGVLDGPSLAAKLGAPVGRSPLLVALEGRFTVPLERELKVGAPGAGEEIYLTGGASADWEALLLATLDFTDGFPLLVHANLGWAFNEEDRGRRFFPDYYAAVSAGADATSNDALVLRGAVEFPGRSIDLFTEFTGDLRRNTDLVATKENPLSITPGVRLRLGAVCATVGFTVGLSGNDVSTPDFDPHDAYPDWELTASVGYGWPVTAADTDGDGIPDFRDACRMQAEDWDGFEDADGCPDPDNDGDGIPDTVDAAPDLPEDIDGFEDDDGVPDLDNDGDGIIDERDMCPDEKEDLDGFEDEDGCPDD